MEITAKYRNKQNPRLLNQVLLLIAILFTTLLFSELFVQKVHANHLNMNTNSSGVPTNRQGHNNPNWRKCNYGQGTFARAIVSWISERDDPTSELNPFRPSSQEVNEGYQLRYNMLGHNCTSNLHPQTDNDGSAYGYNNRHLLDKHTIISRANVVSVGTNEGGVTVDGISSGSIYDLNWSNTYGGNPEYFYVKQSPNPNDVPSNKIFTLKGLSGLTPGLHNIEVTLRTRWVNQYTPGEHDPTGGAQYVCVNPHDRIAENGLSGTNCDPNDIKITVVVEIPQQSAAELTVRTSGLPSRTSIAMNTEHHSAGDCGSSFSVSTGSGRICKAGRTSNGRACEGTVSHQYHGIGCPNGLGVSPRESSIPSDYRFVGWEYSVSVRSCTNNLDDEAACVNLFPAEKLTITAVFERIATGICPSLNNNPNVGVRLPDASPSNNGPPPSYTTSRNAGYTEYRRENRTRVTGTDDISTGEYSINVGNAPFRLPLISESYQNATISYQPFIDRCPFDRNQARVTYLSYYEQRSWRSGSSPSRYTCNSGDSRSGTTCTHTYTVTEYHTHQDGSRCGYIRSGRNRYERRCNHGHSQTRSYTYPATAWYSYSPTSGWQDRQVSDTADARIMEPCWNRTYDSTPSITGLPTVEPDRENPTRSAVSYRINVSFGVQEPRKGADTMRTRTRVNNLDYALTYRIVDSNDRTRRTGVVNRSTNISASNGSRRSSGTYNNNYTLNGVLSVPATIQVGDKICWKMAVTRAGPAGSRKSGVVNVDGNIQSGTGWVEASEVCSDPVVNWPYLKIYGGDVMAGGGFGPSCSVNQGDIRSVTRPSGSSFVGSSVQYASLALGTINGFYSASLRTSDPRPQHGLSFANTPGAGGYSDNDRCLPNYFGYNTNASSYTGMSNLTSANANPKVYDRYQTSSSVTLSAPGASPINIPSGARKVLFVDGDVTIRNNIEYPNLWLTRDSVPALYIVARNIHIDKNVTRLDGVFIAQSSNSSNGVISTCHGTTQSSQFDDCRNQLLINGSFIARAVNFQRTYGSLRDGITQERAGSNRACSNMGSVVVRNVCAGEVFQFSPEVFLAPTPFGSQAGSGLLDSYGGLPPNL